MSGPAPRGLSTSQIMGLALEMAGMTRVPGDSAVYVEGANLTRVLFGIDIEAGELMLARGLGCDGVIAHHPAGGAARLNFPEVLTRQVELMVDHGVPVEVARDAIQPALTRSVLMAQTANFDRVPSAARLIGMPFLNVHLPLDELGRRIMVRALDQHLARIDHEPLVQDAIDALRTIPELDQAPTRMMVPVGAIDHPLGRVAVVHGAGTNGGAAVARAYFAAGIGTVVYIHVAPDQAEILRQEGRGNLIVTGHIASDLIGINPFVAALEQHGVEVIRASGL